MDVLLACAPKLKSLEKCVHMKFDSFTSVGMVTKLTQSIYLFIYSESEYTSVLYINYNLQCTNNQKLVTIYRCNQIPKSLFKYVFLYSSIPFIPIRFNEIVHADISMEYDIYTHSSYIIIVIVSQNVYHFSFFVRSHRIVVSFRFGVQCTYICSLAGRLLVYSI